MDFNWPLNKTWGGYLNPFYKQCVHCSDCGGSGASPEYQKLQDQWYGKAVFNPEDRGSVKWDVTDRPIWALAKHHCEQSPGYYGSGNGMIMIEARRLADLFNTRWMHHLNADDVKALLDKGRLMDFTHTPINDEQREIVRKKVADGGNSWLPESNGHVPSPAAVNAWSLSGMGYDSINCWTVIAAECERLNLPPQCAKCKGEGSIWPSPTIKQQAEDWQNIEPPAGDGYQLWETVSDGSPISPVFSTPEQLAEWLATSMEYKWRRNDQGTTREQWLKFINGPGWCMSLIVKDGQVMTGVEVVQ